MDFQEQYEALKTRRDELDRDIVEAVTTEVAKRFRESVAALVATWRAQNPNDEDAAALERVSALRVAFTPDVTYEESIPTVGWWACVDLLDQAGADVSCSVMVDDINETLRTLLESLAWDDMIDRSEPYVISLQR